MRGQTGFSKTVNFSPEDLSIAILLLRAKGFYVYPFPPELLAGGVILVAYNSLKGDGYFFCAAVLRLLAHYGTLDVLDPDWMDSRPRHERDTRNRAQKYVEAALARAVHEMRVTGEGNRNNTLSRLMYNLGRLEALGLQYERVSQEMLEAALAVGLPQSEVEATLAAAWRKGTANPAKLREQLPSKPVSRSSRLNKRWRAS